MIDRTYCQEQLLRLSGLPGYPKTDDGKRSLIDAFQGAFGFAGQEKLRRWIDDVLRHTDRCPLPRDAYKRGGEVTPGRPQPKTRCFACYDTGRISAEFLVTWRGDQIFYNRLTPEQAAELRRKHLEAQQRGDLTATFRPKKQDIHEYPVPCQCRPEARPMPPAPQEREWYEREVPA